MYIDIDTYIRLCACMYVCMQVDVYVYIYVRTCALKHLSFSIDTMVCVVCVGVCRSLSQTLSVSG